MTEAGLSPRPSEPSPDARANGSPVSGGPEIDLSAPGEHLLLLADYIALRISEGPDKGLAPNQILGKAKTAKGDMLKGSEAHALLGLLAMNPDIDPLYNGNFAFKPEAVFTPRTPGFEESRFARTPDQPANNGEKPLTPRRLARLVHDMHNTPEFRRMREDRGRIANPRSRNNRRGNDHRARGRSPKRAAA